MRWTRWFYTALIGFNGAVLVFDLVFNAPGWAVVMVCCSLVYAVNTYRRVPPKWVILMHEKLKSQDFVAFAKCKVCDTEREFEAEGPMMLWLEAHKKHNVSITVGSSNVLDAAARMQKTLREWR